MELTERAQKHFWSKVALPNEQGCMLWLAYVRPDGYGQFTDGRKKYVAHRVAYELLVGPIPSGMELDHVKANGCTNKHCVAPLHLEAVTHAENVRRAESPVSANSRKTHCDSGHAYDEANTYNAPKGRDCRACARDRQAVRRSRRAAA